MKQQIQTLLDVVRGHKLYIQTHNFPDPDAIASAFGLQYFFRHFGIESSLIYDGSIDRSALFKMIELMGIEFTAAQQVSDMLENDYIVTVDIDDGWKCNWTVNGTPDTSTSGPEYKVVSANIYGKYQLIGYILDESDNAVAAVLFELHG